MVDTESEEYKQGQFNGCLLGGSIVFGMPFAIIGGWTFGVWFINTFFGG